MDQTPQSKININAELTPQTLEVPKELPTAKDISPMIQTPGVNSELTMAPKPEPTLSDAASTASNIGYSGMELNKENTLEEQVNIIRNNLYNQVLTPELEQLIIKYVDAYHATLDYCLKVGVPDEAKAKELELLSGPINEIYNPNNTRIFDGNSYPAVELILNKVDEYASGLDKGFSRIRMPANASASQPEENPWLNTLGYLSVLLVFISVVVFSIALGYLLFILKK